ncbi:MAG: glycosyltransferase [Planctomycetota bacterium]|jgi:glycosyltransferase involved in cell wall biosynthesis
MKILHLINAYSPIFGCGPADRCQKMAAALVSHGHEVTVFTSDHSWDAEFAGATPGVEVVSFPTHGGRFCYTPAMRPALNARIREFDVIHLMNHWTYQNTLGYQAATAARIPFLFSPMGALPIVYRSFLIKKLYHWLYGRHMLKEAAGVIAITPLEIQQQRDHGVEEERIHYVPNAIDLQEYDPKPAPGLFRSRFDLPDDRKIILFLGRLAHIKGPDVLLEAFADLAERHPDALLVLAGPDYGMVDGLKATVEARELKNRVLFPGALTGEIKRAAYAEADLFIVPSRQENMSIVAVEAAVSGTPVIITEACDFREIGTYEAGAVVPCSPRPIGEAISRFLSDTRRRTTCGENARRMVEELYTWDRIGEQMDALLKQTVGGG